MRVIVAGSRSFNDYDLLSKYLSVILGDVDRPIIISGNARGADKLGEAFAINNDLELIQMPADWDRYGYAAGPIRNKEMAEIADACVCFWNGSSRGTRHMIETAKNKGLKLRVIRYDRINKSN